MYKNDKSKRTNNIFVKLINKDQLFVIKINTFKGFYDESIKYIKMGKDVFIKATYYQINNVMIGLSYNESTSILSDLNPDYATTHEWTKEYFDIEKSMHIDYTDFDLDYYLEEDEDEWLNLEKSLESIIKNFITYLNSSIDILYAEVCIKQLREDHELQSKDSRKIKRNLFCCSFKINITDLVLLALELKRFPPYDSHEEETPQIEFSENSHTTMTPGNDNALGKFRSERLPPQTLESFSKMRTSPLFFEKDSTPASYTQKDSIGNLLTEHS